MTPTVIGESIEALKWQCVISYMQKYEYNGLTEFRFFRSEKSSKKKKKKKRKMKKLEKELQTVYKLLQSKRASEYVAAAFSSGQLKGKVLAGRKAGAEDGDSEEDSSSPTRKDAHSRRDVKESPDNHNIKITIGRSDSPRSRSPPKRDRRSRGKSRDRTPPRASPPRRRPGASPSRSRIGSKLMKLSGTKRRSPTPPTPIKKKLSIKDRLGPKPEPQKSNKSKRGNKSGDKKRGRRQSSSPIR